MTRDRSMMPGSLGCLLVALAGSWTVPAFGATPAAPTISSYAATNPKGAPISSAPPGAPLLIEGQNLGSSGTVAFNGIPAKQPASWSPTEILVTVPAAPSYPFKGPVTVTAGGLTASGPAFTITAPPSAPRPGDLDPGFGVGGKVLTKFGNDDALANAVAVQPDSRIVAAGNDVAPDGTPHFALARYTASGALDSSFGTGGKVVMTIGDAGFANAVLVQPDGRIVAGGWSGGASGQDFALARYNSNGSLDTAFGSGGKVLTDFGGEDEVVFALALQPDGRIVAAGRSDGSGKDSFALARYNPDGSLDSSFGSGGKLLTDFGGDAQAIALALQPNGQIVAAGAADALGPYLDTVEDFFALARYNSNGSLDTAFGSGGKVAIDFQGGWAYGVALLPDGRIMAAGGAPFDSSGSPGFQTILYNADGSLVTPPAQDKTLTVFGNNANAWAYGIAVQPDGHVVVAGRSDAGGTDDFALARYNGDGSLDPTFGNSGEVLTDFGDNEEASALALQPDGQIVLAGSSISNGRAYFALARYQGR